MKLVQETEDASQDRKFIKSQVEKRRRERMNCSLERLRSMLLQEPQKLTETQHRVEKAEILENTVLFLQNTWKADEKTAATGGGGGGQKRSFQDGFSSCLQRAAHFLGPQGKGLWLGAALDASLQAGVARSDSDAAGLRRTEVSPPWPHSSRTQTKSIVRMLRQKSRHGPHRTVSAARPYQRPVQQLGPSGAPRKQSPLEVRSGSRAVAPSLSQSGPVWRPWP